MKAEFVNPFLTSVITVMESVVEETPAKGQMYLRKETEYAASEVAIIVGITGMIQGSVVISLSNKCALGMAEKMLMEPVTELHDDARSCLAECGNMIAANSTIGLNDAGYEVDITPPTVITGNGIRITAQEGCVTLVLPFNLSFGDMEINVSLAEKK